MYGKAVRFAPRLLRCSMATPSSTVEMPPSTDAACSGLATSSCVHRAAIIPLASEVRCVHQGVIITNLR